VKQVLEPLAAIPGVRRVMLYSHEGVPIVAVEASRKPAHADGERQGWADSAEDRSAFAGLAVGWLNEIRRTVDPLSWEAPTRVVLQASRGTLVLLVLERAVLSVELDRGVAHEDLRLPMEAAEARFHRHLLRKGREGATPTATEEPRGIFPGGEGAPTGDGQGVNEEARNNEVPEATRDC